MLTASNSLLQSGSQISVAEKYRHPGNKRRRVYIQRQCRAAINRFSISFTQNITGATMHSLYEHTQVGNISLFFSW